MRAGFRGNSNRGNRNFNQDRERQNNENKRRSNSERPRNPRNNLNDQDNFKKTNSYPRYENGEEENNRGRGSRVIRGRGNQGGNKPYNGGYQ